MQIKIKDKTFTYRFATIEDIDKINNFDKLINKDLDKKFYFRHTKKMLENMISKDKKIILIFHQNKLVSWGALNTKIGKEHKKIYKFTKNQEEKAGILLGAAVSKRYRGYNLQRYLIKIRIDYLKKLNKKYALLSVHPNNEYSIINIINSGFKYKTTAKSLNSNKNTDYYILKI